MKIRIKFAKTGVMKFIGHLDIMRYFQKAIRRADIAIAYSEGYSPHQVMSFAAPLGVGITSQGEYLDIEVTASRTSREALDALNQVMVEGMEILSYQLLPEGGKNAMSLVTAADYFVYPKFTTEMLPASGKLQPLLENFYKQQEEILITKQTKKNEVTLNLKEYIYELRADSRDGKEGLFFRISAGSSQNIKPGLVMTSFFRYLGKEYREEAFQEHRLEIYTGTEVNFIPLDALGENIA